MSEMFPEFEGEITGFSGKPKVGPHTVALHPVKGDPSHSVFYARKHADEFFDKMAESLREGERLVMHSPTGFAI